MYNWYFETQILPTQRLSSIFVHLQRASERKMRIQSDCLGSSKHTSYIYTLTLLNNVATLNYDHSLSIPTDVKGESWDGMRGGIATAGSWDIRTCVPATVATRERRLVGLG